jgi:hypothetical protein
MAAMMSTTTAPRHGARRLGPAIPIVMAEIYQKQEPLSAPFVFTIAAPVGSMQ